MDSKSSSRVVRDWRKACVRRALLSQASVKGKLMKVGKVGSIYSTKCLFSNINYCSLTSRIHQQMRPNLVRPSKPRKNPGSLAVSG